jgi:hypothetical protein
MIICEVWSDDTVLLEVLRVTVRWQWRSSSSASK